jgi:hypothetical protein
LVVGVLEVVPMGGALGEDPQEDAGNAHASDNTHYEYTM